VAVLGQLVHISQILALHQLLSPRLPRIRQPANPRRLHVALILPGRGEADFRQVQQHWLVPEAFELLHGLEWIGLIAGHVGFLLQVRFVVLVPPAGQLSQYLLQVLDLLLETCYLLSLSEYAV